MAVITRERANEMWRRMFQKGQGKEEIKADRLPNPTEQVAIFQAIEDFWVDNRLALKNDMDTAANRTLTVAQARLYLREWLRDRLGRE